jgi:hypothetical protein
VVSRGEGITFALRLCAPRVTDDVARWQRTPVTAFKVIALLPSLAAILALALT